MCYADSGTQLRRKKRIALSLVVGLAAGLVSSGILYAQETPPQSRITVAVLNFVNRNPGDGWDWLQKGLADMLITDLAGCGKFQVVERERMQKAFEELALAPVTGLTGGKAAEVARVLKAQKCVLGNYAVEGNELILQAQIVDAWSGELERVEEVRGPVADLFELEKAIALRLVERFGQKLTDDERRLLLFVPTDSLDAAQHHYLGLDLQDRGKPNDALREYRLSLKKDPKYGAARYRVANLYFLLGETPHARLEFKRLSELNPDCPEACPALMFYADTEEDLDKAVAVYEEIARRWPQDIGYSGTSPRRQAITRAAKRVAERGQFKRAFELFYRTHGDALPYSAERGLLERSWKWLLAKSYSETGTFPTGYPQPIVLSPDRPFYEEDYSDDKRFEEAIECDSFPTGPFEFRVDASEKEPPHLASAWATQEIADAYTKKYMPGFHYFIPRPCWEGRCDQYAFGAAPGHIFRQVTLKAECYGENNGRLNFRVISPDQYLRPSGGGTAPIHSFGVELAGQRTLEQELKLPQGCGLFLFSLEIVSGKGPVKLYKWRVEAQLEEQGPSGALFVDSDYRAKVFLDGAACGLTPLRLPNIPVGEHELVFDPWPRSRSTWKRWETNVPALRRTVTLEEGQAEHVAVRFFEETRTPVGRWSKPVTLRLPAPYAEFAGGRPCVLPVESGAFVIAEGGVRTGGTTTDTDLLYAIVTSGESGEVVMTPLPPPINRPDAWSSEPSLIRAPDGGLALGFKSTWYDSERGSCRLLVCTSRHGRVWSPPVVAHSVEGRHMGGHLLDPQVIVGRNHQYVLSYRVPATNIKGELFCVLSPDGMNWSQPVMVLERSKERTIICSPCAAAHQDGTLWLAWKLEDGIEWMSTTDPRHWPAPSRYPDHPAACRTRAGGFASFLRLPAGEPLLVWAHRYKGLVGSWYDGRWSEPEVIFPFGQCRAAALDGGGRLWVVAGLSMNELAVSHTLQPIAAPRPDRKNDAQ